MQKNPYAKLRLQQFQDRRRIDAAAGRIHCLYLNRSELPRTSFGEFLLSCRCRDDEGRYLRRAEDRSLKIQFAAATHNDNQRVRRFVQKVQPVICVEGLCLRVDE